MRPYTNGGGSTTTPRGRKNKRGVKSSLVKAKVSAVKTTKKIARGSRGDGGVDLVHG